VVQLDAAFGRPYGHGFASGLDADAMMLHYHELAYGGHPPGKCPSRSVNDAYAFLLNVERFAGSTLSSSGLLEGYPQKSQRVSPLALIVLAVSFQSATS
jgi:hypothetical protein